ncbi:D-alanyl-D-alanine carboxypeptidase family protein [Methyloligella halotolerans]|uniref:D-alanyl-D-alanine carboxypeptidase family protein n=1 Tax=Methyloligella halotolerans TaxID=1177755 RepID=UPI001FD9C655|nr:D-alanyl-D-alanine carboxypeptidase family protein [Methyloligella halotolerans]
MFLAMGGLASKAVAEDFATTAKNAILVEADTGIVLFEKDADAKIDPASMSKLMTLAVVFKQLKEGRIKLDQEFEVSEHAWRTGGAPSGTSAMFAPIHSKVTVEQLIQGITVQSGNDACLILAEGIAGSEEKFVKLMNDYAKEIGLSQSHFANSTGLTADGHVMSVRDIETLAEFLRTQYPEYYHYFGQPTFEFTRFTFRNRNPLLDEGIGVDGLKTGYTKDAGYGLVASAEQKGRRINVVVAGLPSQNDREKEAKKLIQWAYKHFKRYRLFDEGEKVSRALVWGGEKHYVKLVGKGDIDVLLPISDNPKVTASIAYQGPVKAPVKKGDHLGYLRVEGVELKTKNEIPLYAGEDIAPSGFAWRGLDSLFVLAFGWAL